MFDVEYYELPNGEKPVKTFIDSLDVKMRAKALGSIEILITTARRYKADYERRHGK